MNAPFNPPRTNAGQGNELTVFSSPIRELPYRALVFARQNREQALYFVAGVEGGPWSAANALSKSHRFLGGPCFYCGKQVAKDAGTVDHVEPVCQGGKSVIQNVVMACKPCNSKKGHQVIEHFNPKAGRAWLEALLDQVRSRLEDLDRAPKETPKP